MLRLALALLVLASLPATASAAGFGELPFLPVRKAARCVRATGAPGELVRWADGGAELIQATPSGFGASTSVPLGDTLPACPAVAAQPGGAGVLATELDDGIGVSLRDPGGGWTPPVRIPLQDIHSVESLTAAIDPRGDAVVAWTETQELGRGLGARVRVARRTAGGGLGAPVGLGRLSSYHAGPPEVRVGMQADGTVVALWTQDNPRSDFRDAAFAAVAPPGQPFGPPQRLSDAIARTPSLAVAPDGRALAVLPQLHRTPVLERPPGGAFARVAALGPVNGLDGQAAVALRPDGAAVVAWTDLDTLSVFAVRRDGPGRFGRRLRVGPAPEEPYGAALPLTVDGAPGDLGGRAVRAAFAGDGRPLVSWGATLTSGDLSWSAASAATFPGTVQTLGGPLRDADSIAPVILADGTPAVAWSDVAPGGDARLHLAVEGAADAVPAVTDVRIGTVGQVPHGLLVPVGCSAACDVRASVPGGAAATASASGAGSARLRIDAEYTPIELRRHDSVPVRVLSGPAGAHTARARTITAHLRVPPLPRIRDLVAVRRRRALVVSWRTDRPVRGADVVVQALKGDVELSFETVVGKGRRRFRVRLEDAAGARVVRLFVITHRDAAQRRLAVLRVSPRG